MKSAAERAWETRRSRYGPNGIGKPVAIQPNHAKHVDRSRLRQCDPERNGLLMWLARKKFKQQGIDVQEMDPGLTYYEIMDQLEERIGNKIPKSAIMQVWEDSRC